MTKFDFMSNLFISSFKTCPIACLIGKGNALIGLRRFVIFNENKDILSQKNRMIHVILFICSSFFHHLQAYYIERYMIDFKI